MIGKSIDGRRYLVQLDRCPLVEGERAASRYVKGRSKYQANWHDSHTMIGCLACKEGKWPDRDPLGNEPGAYYNEPSATYPTPCVRHYILRYAYAYVIASIVHESLWFMSSYERCSRARGQRPGRPSACLSLFPYAFDPLRRVVHLSVESENTHREPFPPRAHGPGVDYNYDII